MIPKAITREIEKLVRDRARWKRKALDGAADRSPDRKREIGARDRAVELLLNMIWLYGVQHGWDNDLWDVLRMLRPDVAATMSSFDDAREARRRFFPRTDDDD